MLSLPADQRSFTVGEKKKGFDDRLDTCTDSKRLQLSTPTLHTCSTIRLVRYNRRGTDKVSGGLGTGRLDLRRERQYGELKLVEIPIQSLFNSMAPGCFSKWTIFLARNSTTTNRLHRGVPFRVSPFLRLMVLSPRVSFVPSHRRHSKHARFCIEICQVRCPKHTKKIIIIYSVLIYIFPRRPIICLTVHATVFRPNFRPHQKNTRMERCVAKSWCFNGRLITPFFVLFLAEGSARQRWTKDEISASLRRSVSRTCSSDKQIRNTPLSLHRGFVPPPKKATNPSPPLPPPPPKNTHTSTHGIRVMYRHLLARTFVMNYTTLTTPSHSTLPSTHTRAPCCAWRLSSPAHTAAPRPPHRSRHPTKIAPPALPSPARSPLPPPTCRLLRRRCFLRRRRRGF